MGHSFLYHLIIYVKVIDRKETYGKGEEEVRLERGEKQMQREKRMLKSVFSTNLIETILRFRMLQHPKTGDLNNPKPLHKW